MTRAIGAVLFLLLSSPVGAQTAISLRLRVVAAGEADPLRRARVTSAGESDAPPVFSDEDGVAVVTARVGTQLRVSKAGYARQLVRVPRRMATIEVVMAPAAAITGRVVDSNGAPGVRISVVVRRLAPLDAASPSQLEVRTDDRGEFRAGGLVAGRYQVYSERGLDMTGVLDRLPPGGAPAAMADRVRQGREAASNVVTVTPAPGEHADVTLIHPTPSIEFPFSEGGVVSGTLMDEVGEPAEGARVSLIATGRTGISHMTGSAMADDLGRYRLYQIPPGRYLLVVTDGEGDPVPGVAGVGGVVRVNGTPMTASSSLPLYYPGSFNPSEATPLVIERGRELAGMNLVVRTMRGVRVFGTVTSVPGTTQRPIGLKPLVPWTVVAPGSRSGAVRADGSFELTNVPPGEYVLQALAAAGPAQPSLPTDVRFAALRIVVGTEDVGAVVLSPAATSAISGRVTLDGDRDGVVANDFWLAVLPVDPAEAPEPYQIGGERVLRGSIQPESDWTFRVIGLSGPTRFGLTRAPQGWWLREVRIGGRNAAYEPAPFGAPEDSRNDVEIVLSNRGASVGGRTTDSDNQPVELYTVLIFPTDRDRWFTGSSLIKTTTSRSDGTFLLPSLAPGDYLVVAAEFSELDPNADDLLQPEALARLASSARRVTLAEGQQQRVDLQLSPGAR
jgi:hypothetical protein